MRVLCARTYLHQYTVDAKHRSAPRDDYAGNKARLVAEVIELEWLTQISATYQSHHRLQIVT